MVSKRDIAFGQVIAGIIFVFIPILAIYNLPLENTFSWSILMAFVLFGIVAGFLSGILMLRGYYKLTEKLKEEW